MAAETKAASPARWRGRERGAGRGKKKKKVDLPVAQLLAAHSRYYLLRLESPVSRGRTAEEAKYVTGDRQVSDRARRSVGISASEGRFWPLSFPPPPPQVCGDFVPRFDGIASDIEKPKRVVVSPFRQV